MAKVRFQMFIEQTQKEALEKLQQNSGMSVAELVRVAINNFLKKHRKKDEKQLDEITEKLLSVAGIYKGGPPDLADSIDEYLYGFPRKK